MKGKRIFLLVLFILIPCFVLGQDYMTLEDKWIQKFQEHVDKLPVYPMPQMILYPQINDKIIIESRILNEEKNQLEILFRTEYSVSWGFEDESPNIDYYKEIYGIVDGRIELIKIINASYIDSVVTEERIIKKKVFK